MRVELKKIFSNVAITGLTLGVAGYFLTACAQENKVKLPSNIAEVSLTKVDVTDTNLKKYPFLSDTFKALKDSDTTAGSVVSIAKLDQGKFGGITLVYTDGATCADSIYCVMDAYKPSEQKSIFPKLANRPIYTRVCPNETSLIISQIDTEHDSHHYVALFDYDGKKFAENEQAKRFNSIDDVPPCVK